MSTAARTLAYRAFRLLLCLAAALTVIAMHGLSSDHLLAMPTPASAAVAVAAEGPGPHRLHPVPPLGPVSSGDRIALLRGESDLSRMSHPDCLATQRLATVSAPPVSLDVLAPGRATETAPATTMPVAPRGPPKPSLDRLCISRT